MTIYEREPSLDARPRDWTIVLHWALPTFKKLLPESIIANLSKAICNPYLDFNAEVECLPCINGKTGELLFSSPMPGSRRVTRQRLRKVLVEGVDIRWGKRLLGMNVTDESVKLSFEDGETTEADFVLGTDGASSKVRDLLHGGDEKAKVKPSGYMFATTITKHGDAEKVEAVVKAHPVAVTMMGTESVGGVGGTLFVPFPMQWNVTNGR